MSATSSRLGRALLATAWPLLTVGCAVDDPPRPRPAGESAINESELVNVAGQQRMLTQRIVKSYAQMYLNVQADLSQAQLNASTDRFRTQLELLRTHPINQRTRLPFEELEASWLAFLTLVANPPNRDRLMALSEEADRLLAHQEKLVRRLVDAACASHAQVVNIAGRQRMLSQRFAKLYMLGAAGLGSDVQTTTLLRTRNEFHDALDLLRGSPINTPATIHVLDAMATDWSWLERSLDIQSDVYYPWIVADASEKTLAHAEALTGMYESLDAGSTSAEKRDDGCGP